LLFLDLRGIPAEAIKILCIRVVFFIVIGFLVVEEASAKRRELQRALRAETALQRSERLTALGQLTAGLAHELRNPIATAKASAEMLMKPSAQSNPEIVSEISSYVISEIDRTASLISQFIDFSKPLASRPECNDLNSIVESVFSDAGDLARASDVHLRKTITRGQVLFIFDADLLKLALLNLVKNAIEASYPGQAVILYVEERSAEVSISVSDEGSGIDPQYRESVFNPFFTTKSNAIGLGLATVSRVVDVCRGRVSFTSAPGSGTTFQIFLPRQTKN
jgi:signal transduction histidine kinase